MSRVAVVVAVAGKVSIRYEWPIPIFIVAESMSRLKFDVELYFGSNRIYCPASGTAKLVNWVDFFGRTCVSGVWLNGVVNTETWSSKNRFHYGFCSPFWFQNYNLWEHCSWLPHSSFGTPRTGLMKPKTPKLLISLQIWVDETQPTTNSSLWLTNRAFNLHTFAGSPRPAKQMTWLISPSVWQCMVRPRQRNNI